LRDYFLLYDMVVFQERWSFIWETLQCIVKLWVYLKVVLNMRLYLIRKVSQEGDYSVCKIFSTLLLFILSPKTFFVSAVFIEGSLSRVCVDYLWWWQPIVAPLSFLQLQQPWRSAHHPGRPQVGLRWGYTHQQHQRSPSARESEGESGNSSWWWSHVFSLYVW